MSPTRARSAPSGARLAREGLLARLNLAVRRPAEHGGLDAVARLLDALAAGEARGREAVWIVDTNERLATSMLMREGFAEPDVHVAASQYGEDAYRRGWLRLDRTLTAGEHADLVGRAVDWAAADRTPYEVVGEFGPPSVVFGPADPGLPRTLGYAAHDRTAPFVTFHLGAAEDGAALLGVRVDDGFFGGWGLTPWGESRFG